MLMFIKYIYKKGVMAAILDFTLAAKVAKLKMYQGHL